MGENAVPHVVVTGAAGGIGQAVAQGLASRGWLVGCLDIDEPGVKETVQAIEEAGGAAYSAMCDVTSPAELDDFVTTASREHGPIDGLVANAGGIRGANIPLMEIADRAWESAVDLNLGGVFHSVRAFARHMIPRGSGSIVVITSNAAFVAIPGLAHYSAAKGGAHSLVRSVAFELAPHNVRVNAVAPGPIRTEANKVRLDDPDQLAKLLPRVPMGRAGLPHEITGAVAYLLGPDATYTTGTTINVDGGFTCL